MQLHSIEIQDYKSQQGIMVTWFLLVCENELLCFSDVLKNFIRKSN